MRRLLAALLLTILLLSQHAASVAVSAPASLAMTVEAAFGGRFKYGEWLPVFVTIENSGPDLTGEVRVRITHQTGQLDFVTPAELPAGARKRFTVYILPNNFSRTAQVELVEGETILLTGEAKLTVLSNDRYVIGLVGTHAAGMMAMNPPHLPGRRERSELVGLSLEEIPDRYEGLRLLNALVLNDVDTTLLTPAQRAALRGWVASGGRLVLGGGASAGRTLAGLPAELQPATLTGQLEAPDLSSLKAYAGEPVQVPGPFLLAGVQPQPAATVLLSQDTAGEDAPLLVEQTWGAGYIDFVTLDLSQSPFNAWAGVTPFARQLLSPGASWPDYLPPDISPNQMSDSQMSYALTNLPALDLPSVRFLGLLLAGYVILVGPANYFFLRWRDRLAWAWITIPALTLVFSGVAYGISFGLRGSDIIVNQISVIEMGQDGQVKQARTYVGIFSPSRQAYDVEVSGQTLIRPLGEAYNPWSGSVDTGGTMRVVQSEPARVRGLAVNQWSMQSFVAETASVAAPDLVSELVAERDNLHGQLTNRGDVTWQDVVIVFNSQFQKLGDLEPGQAADIRLDFSRNQDILRGFGSYILFQEEFGQPAGPSRETAFKQSVLDSAVFNNNIIRESGAPIILAWQKDSPVQISLKGRTVNSQKSSLLYGRLPLAFAGPYVGVPPGFSHVETLAIGGDAGECNYGPGITGYHLYQGTVEARLALPEALRNVQPNQVDLYIRTDGGWPSLPVVELFDQVSEEWVLLAEARPGLNPIKELEHFYDPASASVRLRISSANPAQGGGCLFFDLAMEGERI